ncbi:uncharacterized protein [Primulina eburnea]|uniref:uncharacterized protein n=1 Tax=Primulina eburnea TaxID=1245227 RepID=UPI003C6C8663
MDLSPRPPTVPSDPEKPLCPKCGRHHWGECRYGTHTCYRCGTAGHVARDCPQGASQERVQGRIFSLTKEDDGDRGGMLASAGTSLVLPFTSCFEAERLLCRGCVGFLAFIVDVDSMVKLNIGDIDVVIEFVDVFELDVPGLPPDRDREFVIALMVPGIIARLSALVIRATLTDRIRREQTVVVQLIEMRARAEERVTLEFRVYGDGLVTLRGCICVPSEFWKSLHRAMGSRLAFSTTYHPQSDGQSERVIQILEDMLRACTIDYPGSWDSMLPLTEFTMCFMFRCSGEYIANLSHESFDRRGYVGTRG